MPRATPPPLPASTGAATAADDAFPGEIMLRELFNIAYILLQVLWWIIIVQIILSWLVAFNVINTRNDFVRSFLNALDRLTRPLYRPVRRILPDFGGIDFSPIVVILLIIVIDRLLLGLASDLARSGAI
ncbi:MAG TPA: YggT family protein [Allosphingosinicella sp.]|nr:YggT family protein [Allosphingosinicella sp.]